MDTMLHPPFSYRNIYGKDSNDHSRNRYNPARCDGSRTPSAATVEKDTASEKNPKKEQAPKAATEIPAAVLAILGKFPDYKELYIDADGSMYTPQTTPAIRGKAILYKNPYYKS